MEKDKIYGTPGFPLISPNDGGRIKYPICPLMVYWEGDENKCNVSKCNWGIETRSCTEECRIMKESKMKFIIKQSTQKHRGWYIRALKDDKYNAWFVWKDLELHIGTGYNCLLIGYAPGYYMSEESAKETLQLFKEKHNMSEKIEITVKVNGKNVPLCEVSEQTLLTIRENSKPEEIPVARTGNYPYEDNTDRLILRVPENIDDFMGEIVVIDLEDGGIVNHWPLNGDNSRLHFYNNVKTL